MVVLIVGFGSIAQKHFGVLKKIDPDVEVYALRSSATAAIIPGVTNVYSYEEIKFQPDFIIISSPTLNHYQDILNCLRFRCPLFIEKPVLGGLEGAEHVKTEIENSGVISYVACVLRFHPCLVYLKNKILVEEKINEVNIYCGSYLPDWRKGKDFRTSYSANKELGGGVHLDLVHELDYTYWLFGKPSYWHSYASSKSTLAINAIDSASYLFAYENFNANITLNYFRRKPKRTIELVTENGTWEADLNRYIVRDEEGNIVFDPSTTIMELYEKQLRYFIHCIQTGTKCENDFNSGLEVLKLCLLNNYAKG